MASQMSGEFVISSVMSRHNKNLKRRMDQCYSFVLQLSFIQKVKENTFSRREGMPTQKTQREERPTAQFRLLFLCFFSPPPGPVICKLDQPGVLFALPEVLTPILGPSFVLFLWAFPFLIFQPLPFWTPFSHSNYVTGLTYFTVQRKNEKEV